MSIAKKDLWEDEEGNLVDKEPARGRTVAVKGGQINEADKKEFEFPADALEDEAEKPEAPPNIVISGPKGQAVVVGQELPEKPEAKPAGPKKFKPAEEAEPKDAAGKDDE